MKDENPFKLLSSKPVYENPWIKVREDAVERPGGQEGIFGVVDVRSGVSVLVVTNDQTILLVKEYKYGLGRYTLECVGGCIDDGEAAEATARREVKEELGVEAAKFTALGTASSLPTIVNFTEHIYLAEGAQIVAPQNTDEGEVIEVVELPIAEVYEKAQTEEITHDMTLVTLFRAQHLLNQ